MNKNLIIILMFTQFSAAFACFQSDPSKYLKTKTIPVVTPYVSLTGTSSLTETPISTIDFTQVSSTVKSISNSYESTEVKVIGGKSYRYRVSISQNNNTITKKTTITDIKSNSVTEKVETFDAEKYGIWNKEIYPIDTRQAIPLTINTQFSGFGQNEKIKRACLLYLNKNGKWIIIVNINNPKQNIVSNNGEKKSPFGINSIKQTYGYKPGQILYILTYYQSENFATHNLKNLLTKKVSDPSKVQGVIAIGIIENERPK